MADKTRRALLRSAAAATLVYGCRPPSSATTDRAGTTDGSTTDGGTLETGTTPTGTDPTAMCVETGTDIEGPFWVKGVPIRSDLDVHGEEGPRLAFEGVVRDATTCEPIADAVVEVWHADRSGDYDGDADGRYRGQVRTDASGAYAFQTVVPGRYLNGPTFRPAHLHIKVWVGGTERLTTQLYFANDPYNAKDAWFDEDRIVADLDGGDALTGTFDLVV